MRLFVLGSDARRLTASKRQQCQAGKGSQQETGWFRHRCSGRRWSRQRDVGEFAFIPRVEVRYVGDAVTVEVTRGPISA